MAKGKIIDIQTGEIATVEDDIKVTPRTLETSLPFLRMIRNDILAQSDWMANSDVTMSDEWRTYRQALRDITESATSLDDVTWPTEPTG